MPQLALSEGYEHASAEIHAVMLWPSMEDQEHRRQFCTATQAFELVKSGKRGITVSREMLDALLDTPSWSSLQADIVQRTRRAVLAGNVMSSMFVASLIEDGLPDRARKKAKTLTMAYESGRRWAENLGKYGDGLLLPMDQRKWENCWYEFRSVAHIWSAKELLAQFRNVAGKEVATPGGLKLLLELATTIQEFGTNFRMTKKSKQGSDILLPRSELWTIDMERHPPMVLTEEDIAPLRSTDFATFLSSR